MRHAKLLSSAVGIFFCLSTFAAVGAYAQTWDFTQSNDNTAVPCSVLSPCGSVTLDVTSSTSATFTVTSDLTGYVFDTFGFNGPAGLTLFSYSGELGITPKLDGTGAEDGFGKFDYKFLTDLSGGSSGTDCTVTGGSPGAGCTFSFTVDGTGLMAALFEITSSGGNGSGYFAGHLAAAGDKTVYVGDTVSVVPEGGAALLYLVLAGLTCFGAIRFSSKNQYGNRMA